MIRRLAEDLREVERRERQTGDEITDTDIQLQRTKIDAAEEKQKRTKELLDDIETDSDHLKAESERLQEQFRNLFGTDPIDSKAVQRLERQRNKIASELAGIDRDILGYASNALPLAMLAPVFPDLLDQLDRESEQRDVEILEEFAPDLARELVEQLFCPQTYCCRRSLPEADIAKLQTLTADAIRGFQPETVDATPPFQHLGPAQQADVRAKLQDVERRQGELFRLQEDREDLGRKVDDLDQELGRRRLGSEDQEEAEALREEIETASERLGRKKQEHEEVQREYVPRNDEIARLRNELDDLYEKHEQSTRARALIETCRSTQALLDEYVDSLRHAKIEELAGNILTMYKKLATKASLIDRIEIDPASYAISIRDVHGDEVQKQSLSAGEKEIFAISLLWGLAQTSNFDLPVVVDTPLARLDSQHRDQIASEYFPNAAEQVIVLSTDTEVDEEYYRSLEPYLQHTVHLVFDPSREITTIEEGYFWR